MPYCLEFDDKQTYHFFSNGIPIFWLSWSTMLFKYLPVLGILMKRKIPRISRQSLLVYCSRSLRDFCTNFKSFAELNTWALRLACSSCSLLEASQKEVSSIFSYFVVNNFIVAKASSNCSESGLSFSSKIFSSFSVVILGIIPCINCNETHTTRQKTTQNCETLTNTSAMLPDRWSITGIVR